MDLPERYPNIRSRIKVALIPFASPRASMPLNVYKYTKFDAYKLVSTGANPLYNVSLKRVSFVYKKLCLI